MTGTTDREPEVNTREREEREGEMMKEFLKGFRFLNVHARTVSTLEWKYARWCGIWGTMEEAIESARECYPDCPCEYRIENMVTGEITTGFHGSMAKESVITGKTGTGGQHQRTRGKEEMEMKSEPQAFEDEINAMLRTLKGRAAATARATSVAEDAGETAAYGEGTKMEKKLKKREEITLDEWKKIFDEKDEKRKNRAGKILKILIDDGCTLEEAQKAIGFAEEWIDMHNGWMKLETVMKQDNPDRYLEVSDS